MTNKIIIGMLVLLLLLMGGFGYYSYTLNQQVDALGEQLTTFEAEQAARIGVLNDALAALRQETSGRISHLEEKTQAEIDALKKTAEVTENRVASFENEIYGITSQVEGLENRLADSVIDAGEVYQRVSQATVRISDGWNTLGSGVILDNEAHVLTAHHVVENLSQIYVIMYDGRISRATSIGSCQFSDIAVLKLEDNPAIEPPPLADSSRIKVGEPVAAIGAPLDQRDTLTTGIISQVNRFADIQYDTQSRWVPNLLQFDAPINFGNSGGPLFNAGGEVIGIVIARVHPTEGDGIYWAVAANKVKRVAEAIISQGRFDYPWIGINMADLTPQLVRDMALETANGVIVGSVFSGSPAEAGGIRIDDVIVAMDDIPIKGSADLTSYLGEFKSPGDTARFSLIREGEEIELSLEVGKREQ
jgi:S1-C subfamily serine protease